MRNEARKRGRKLHFPEKILVGCRPGTRRAIMDLKTEGETMLEFIRTAIDREVERRS